MIEIGNRSELYLIAHKVRGQPAFDIAVHMTCPTCEGTNDHCHQCDGAGHWWIIPTSGHRAFPWWSDKLTQGFSIEDILVEIPMPEGLRDHYTTTSEAATDLIKVLGLIHAPLGAKPPPLKRRL